MARRQILTALLRALQQETAQNDDASVEILSDSTYAMRSALGVWRRHPRAPNAELVRRLQVALARLTSRRGHDRVRLSHVRAHARNPGNETVDRLAKRAAQDETFSGHGPDVTEMAQHEYDQAKTAHSGADDLAPTSAPNPTHPSAATPPTSAHFNLPVVAHALGVG